MVYFHISLVTGSKVCQYMSSPTPQCCTHNHITYEGHSHHIPYAVLKSNWNCLPIQNSSDSKVTQLNGTIFGQKNILDRKQKQKSYKAYVNQVVVYCTLCCSSTEMLVQVCERETAVPVIWCPCVGFCGHVRVSEPGRSAQASQESSRKQQTVFSISDNNIARLFLQKKWPFANIQQLRIFYFFMIK